MLDIAFQYSYETNDWVKCTNTEYIKKDIEKLPIVPMMELVGFDKEEMNGLTVFCYKHNREEKIKEINNDTVISVDGCIFEGLFGISKYIKRTHCDLFIGLIPYRWRVFQRDEYSSINIAADVLDMGYLDTRRKIRWYNFAFSIDIIKRKNIISKYGCSYRNTEDWTNLKEFDVPDVVVDVAINAMRNSVKLVYGIKPSVLSRIKGKNKIKAYVERPFDLNIVFLKKFFSEYTCEIGGDGFDDIFPYEEKDNYRIICELLDIKPPKSLRKAYTFNPYSIVWYMIFKQWNIKDINHIQKFLYLDDSIANLYLHKFYFNKTEKCVTRKRNDALEKWEALQFYCKWLREKKGEKKMLAWLYQASVKNNIYDWQWDIMIPFKESFDTLSDEIKDRLLVDGLTVYVHDAISVEITSLSEKWKHERIKYTNNILAYECKIKEYEFRLVHNTSLLPRLGAVFNNCVATYRERVKAKSSIIVYVMNKTGYVACIEIQNERRIVQALGKYNKNLDGETNLFCCYWAKHNNLKIDTDDLCYRVTEKEDEDYYNLIIEQIPYIKYTDEMNLNELLNLDVNRIQEGYYLRLEGMIAENNKHSLNAPYWMAFKDEKSRLTYINPQGIRIYEAAFDGNTEAMRALGFMYYYGHGMQRDYGKSLEWFNKAVDSGSREAEDEIKRLKILVGQCIEGRERIIIEALYNLRKRMAVSSVG